ncbi:MAG: transposase [Acidobacteria bacterium]|nr:transposase [Acidobacteriota bacterium]
MNGVGARIRLLRRALSILAAAPPEYERALVQRGDITLWLSADAIAAWTPAPSGRRGGQRKFSNHAIETALTLRLVFRLPLRQAEGCLRSVRTF